MAEDRRGSVAVPETLTQTHETARGRVVVLPHRVAANSSKRRVSTRGSQRKEVADKIRDPATRFHRLDDPQVRLYFLQQHPFFQDLSTSLRERLAPQLVHPSCLPDRDPVVVVEQNAEPETNGMDYLFVTPPDGHTTLELTFDGRRIATLSGNAVFGQEVVFGVTKRFIFGSRLTSGSVNSLWVIPRKVVQSLLQKDAHRGDARLLKQRAHDDIVSILKTWYSEPTMGLSVRLFDPYGYAFKVALVEEVEIQIISAGSVTCKEYDLQDWALCLWRGEADVLESGAGAAGSFLRLTHGKGQAWAAWWGLMELLGTQVSPHISRHPVKAITDCIIWRLTPPSLRKLQKAFPAECRILEKVALHHAQILQPKAMALHQAPFFQGASRGFLEALQKASTRWILASGEVVYEKGKTDLTRDLFCVARGTVRVVAANVDRSRLMAAAGRQTRRAGVQDELLGEGAVFGENLALQLRNTRAMSVVSETICDLHVMPGEALNEALAQFPDELKRFLDLLEERGYGVVFPEDMAEIGRLSRFPRDFLERLKELCRQKVACGCMKLAQEGEKVQAIRIVFRGKVTADKEDVDFQPHDIKAPTTVGSFAAVDPDCLSPVSLTANSLCGYFEVDVAELQNLLEDYPALRASWQLVVDEEELDAAPMESSLGGIGNRRASRVLVLPEDIAQTDEDEERVIKDTLGKRFEGAEEEFLDCLRDILEKRSFTAEEVILAQGDDGTFAILIASGCCTVEVNGTKVGEVKAGGLIGEAVLLGQASKRTATVRAVGQVVGFAIDQNEIGQIFLDFPEEKQRMVQLANLRNQTNKVLVGKEEERSASRTVPDKSGSKAGSRDTRGASKDLARGHSRQAPAYSKTENLEESVRAARSRGSMLMPEAGSKRGSALLPSGLGVDAKRGSRLESISKRGSVTSKRESVTSKRESITSSRTISRANSGGHDSDSDDSADLSSLPMARVQTEGVGGSHLAMKDIMGRLARRGVPEGRPHTTPSSGTAPFEEPDKPTTAPSRQTSRTALTPACRRWVARRARRIEEAPGRTEARKALAGRLTPMIPKDRSYVCVDMPVRPPTSEHCTPRPPTIEQCTPRRPVTRDMGLGVVTAAEVQLRQASRLYGKPVWHESFQ